MAYGVTGLASIISTSPNIVFFGGAGLSTESGIPDFRSAEGIFSDAKIVPAGGKAWGRHMHPE